jgi:phosphatidylglycerol:prolipoprotein diacylglycerol transferase
MLNAPLIDPVIFSLGPLHVRWYGLMYILAFAAAYFLVRYQARKFSWPEMEKQLDNLLFTLILGVIVGARIGYALFYNLDYFLAHPLEVFATWQGGMSFHGGCIGVLVTGWLYCRHYKLDYWKGADLFAVAVPVGLGLGRIGNFINHELYGRVTELPWGMIFPVAGPLPRHPSQLYEAFFEGLVLFAILWLVKKKPWSLQSSWPHGSIFTLFLILYGFFRFMIEFVREPDAHLGTVFLFMTTGQVLSSVMIIIGVVIFIARRAGRIKTDRFADQLG